VITSPLVNAAANLCLKAVDLTLKFSLAPHMNKTAYFDDILAQALNVLQVGVLFKLIKDKADGVVKGEGLGGDSAGVFFVGGALAAIGPLLFTAMYECFLKLIVLYRKLQLADAKIRDAMNALKQARKNPDDEMKRKKSLVKALKKAVIEGIEKEKKLKEKHPEFVAAPNSVAGVRLTPESMEKYVDTMAKLLARDDSQVILKAAKEMKNQYLISLNMAKPSSSSDEIDPLTKIVFLLEALQTAMNDPSYKAALEMGGKDLLFRLLQLPAGLDLNKDLKAVASRLNSGSLIENIDRFRKVMQMCTDIEKATCSNLEMVKEYLRKSKMVLSELPWPEDYTQERLRIYVGVPVKPKPAEDQAQSTPDGAGNKEQGVVLSVKCSHESETSKYLCVWNKLNMAV
jgi:hypothetical protein